MDRLRRPAKPPPPLTPKPSRELWTLNNVRTNISRFEKAVYGLRNQELLCKIEPTQQNGFKNVNTMDHIRGYGVVASLCSRFMDREQQKVLCFQDLRKYSPHFRRRDAIVEKQQHDNVRLSHKEVTRQLLAQAIEGSDFALLNIIIRMSPCVKGYLEDKDKQGNTLLHRCCKERNHRLAIVLVDLGLDVNKTGEQNRTPLHFAALKNDLGIVQLLLNSCADVFKKDIEGSRPADLCSDPRVRSLLLTRMNSRSRSFNTKRNRPNLHKSDVDLNLSRTDSGIAIENCSIFDTKKRDKTKNGCFNNECMSSFRDFRFSKETVV